jgi:hypothetical protein
MDIARDLETWFKGRPLWLQDAARKLLDSGALDEKAYDILFKICAAQVGIEIEKGDTPKPQCVSAADFSKVAHIQKVELSTISNVVGINALNPRVPLKISDRFTIVYGQNGTGKSGYTRLLKQVCGAKNLGQLYPNAFEGSQNNQSCEIAYKVYDTDHQLIWNADQGINEHLSSIELYDSDCGSVYVVNENQLAYEPEILKLFSALTKASDNLSSRLERLASQLVSKKPLLPQQYLKTEYSQWYSSISAKTTTEIVDNKCVWTKEDQKSLDLLLVRSKEPDPKAKAEKVKKSKKEVDKLIAGFRNWKGKLSDEACLKFHELAKDAKNKQLTASAYAKSVFESSPLKGIGEEAWALLWEHARSYSQTIAYPEIKFPNIDGEAVCVLCQQPLDDNAKNRLSEFEEFVKGKLELAAKDAKQAFNDTKKLLIKPPDEELIVSMITAAGIDELMAQKILELRTRVADSSAELVDSDIDSQFTAKVDFSIIDDLLNLGESMEISATQFEEDAKKDNKQLIEKSINELEAKKWVFQQKPSILEEIALLKKQAKLKKAKSLLSTTSITRKKSELVEKLVTAEYIERFDNEVKKLGAGRIKVKLEKTRSNKGKVFFQIKLQGNKLGLPVDKILSEGEFRIISLAAFFADVEGHADKSTFVFDDPISSLDQDYEENVAERLVELSKTRQVLVFTHRLSFMALIDESIKKQGLTQETIGLYKEAWGTGEPGLPPIHAQKTKAAINTLIGKIPEGRKILNEQGSEAYSWWSKGVCSNTRITIEKVIEFDLLADVVQRFRRPITTQGKLHKVAKVSSDDCDYIDELMSKYSRYEHSQPNEVPVQAPEPDELEADLISLKKWRDEFTKS